MITGYFNQQKTMNNSKTTTSNLKFKQIKGSKKKKLSA